MSRGLQIDHYVIAIVNILITTILHNGVLNVLVRTVPKSYLIVVLITLVPVPHFTAVLERGCALVSQLILLLGIHQSVRIEQFIACIYGW